MDWKNGTEVKFFILLGLSGNPEIQIVLFVSILIIYLIILGGNILIFIVTITDTILQTPMYFFLNNLSFLDICYSSSIIPRMLRDLLSAEKTISFQGCATQMYIALSLGEAECLLLAVMAYDRYIAICYPLHYNTIINRTVCIRVVTITWICGFLLSISHVVLTLNAKFCGRNEINHFFCEVPEIISLACDDTTVIEFAMFVVGVTVLILPVSFIIISYFKIIISVLQISSTIRQQKAFSTCVSHLMVVTLFYGSVVATYMKPRSVSSPDTDKIIAVFYTIITPLLNPLIYTLRNKKVQKALGKITLSKILLLLF